MPSHLLAAERVGRKRSFIAGALAVALVLLVGPQVCRVASRRRGQLPQRAPGRAGLPPPLQGSE
eukprot:10789985-Alexandrium_andersonii.AAC.1